MKRRNFILGLGVTVAGSGVAVGSGAFSSVEAERTVTVETATDDNAYLRLTEPAPESDDRSRRKDGQLDFWLPGLAERVDGGDDTPTPEGLGEDSVYWFGRETDGLPLFRAQNQGSNPIEIYGINDGSDDVPQVKMFNADTGELLTEGDRSGKIGVGDSIDLGLQIDTHGVEVRETSYNVALTIIAEATND